MRDGTGVDLLQTVKKYNRNISFILLSGSDYNFDIKMAEHYGATFIPKGEIDLIQQIVTFADSKKPTVRKKTVLWWAALSRPNKNIATL